MKYNTSSSNDAAINESEEWVREVLDPDQLSTAKLHIGRLALTGKTMLLLWGLRVYVALMVVMSGIQIWNALHAGA